MPAMSGTNGFDANPVHMTRNRVVMVRSVSVSTVQTREPSSNLAAGHTSPEIDVGTQVEDSIDVFEVSAELVTSRKPFCPGPVLPHRLDRVLVVRHVGVDSSAGVAVRLPDAAETA